MEFRVVNRRIRCPFCDESMTIAIDLSAGDQAYIEDCQVCCQPIAVAFEAEDGELLGLRVDCAS